MGDNAENSMPSFSLNCSTTATTDPPDASTTEPQAPRDGLEIPESNPQRDSYPQRSIRHLTSPIVLAGKKKTHICMECVAEIKNQNTRHPNDWHTALCNGSNVSNMWKHLDVHAQKKIHDEGLGKIMKKRFEKRKENYIVVEREGTVTVEEKRTKMGSNGETLTTTKTQSSIVGVRWTTDEQVQQALSRYILETGKPYSMVENPQCREFYGLARSNLKSKQLTREKYNHHVDSYHAIFANHVGQIMEEISKWMYGFPFINLIHDLLTNASVHAVLGASISFIDATWKM
mmetsp:Transcript_15276/g.22492  ORF Transcript_15276/g.22492 Transcript_15276/m.22492 type:complete len:288 (-) Transcript_15276:1257-2120(-)